MTVLVIEDKLGITDGYRGQWESMCMAVGLNPREMRKWSPYKDPYLKNTRLLIQKGNRKSPGFNEPSMGMLRIAVEKRIELIKPEAILCMDVATLGLIEPSWDIATIDNLRGGVYDWNGIPFLVSMPISAINSRKDPKDIRAMNEGVESKAEFEEDEDRDPEEFFFEPYTIPYGRWVLAADMQKLTRILTKRLPSA